MPVPDAVKRYLFKKYCVAESTLLQFALLNPKEAFFCLSSADAVDAEYRQADVVVL